MAIPYSCPHCGHQGKAPDQLSGKVVKCKSCGSPFQVPPQGDFAEPVSAEPVDPGYTPANPGMDYADAEPAYAEAAPVYGEAEAIDAQAVEADVLPADPMEEATPIGEEAPTNEGGGMF